jgi:hypothetical protein
MVEILLPGLGTAYHSPLCADETRQAIIEELLQHNAIQPDEKPPEPWVIVPPNNIKLKKCTNVMAEYLSSYSALEK